MTEELNLKTKLEIVDDENGRSLAFRLTDGTIIKKSIEEVEESIKLFEAFVEKCKTFLNDYKNNINSFVVNEYLKLKLENDKTKIYVNDREFIQCKYLFLNIPVDNIEDFDEINSIDEAQELLKFNRSLEQDQGRYDVGARKKYSITPLQEFRGHCSNLQAWYENNYDTRILHRNIAFPLLKKLSEAGDPIAKRAFKDEIAERLESGVKSVFLFLLNELYLEDFSNEELYLVMENMQDPETKFLLLEHLALKRGYIEAISVIKQMILERKSEIKFIDRYLKLFHDEELVEILDLIKDIEVRFPILEKLNKNNEDNPQIIEKFKEALKRRFETEDSYSFFEDIKKHLKYFPFEEIQSFSDNILNPILKIFILSEYEESIFYRFQYYFRDQFEIFVLEGESLFVCHINNPNVRSRNKEPKPFHEGLKCHRIANKLVYFGTTVKRPNRVKRVVFNLEHIKFARKLLNNKEDLMIALPYGMYPLKLFSESEKLSVYIAPIDLD